MEVTRYAELRAQVLRNGSGGGSHYAVLRDAESDYVPVTISERLVQAIWYDQRLQSERLVTADGKRLTVIFPGCWNVEPGPDFRHATLRFGDEPERKGDVEVHLRCGDWYQHGHDTDPLYNDVILHVVLWESDGRVQVRTRAGQTVPQLVLHPFLDAPLETLYDELDLDGYPYNVRPHGGRCVAVVSKLGVREIHRLLDSAGDERFAGKVRRYLRWIRRLGAEQAFYEAWMEALGYKANKSAFRLLAQRLPLTALNEHRAVLAPLLFGVAGFLPTTASDDPYVKWLWGRWWKLRPDFAEMVLPEDAWKRGGVRPLNHPHRRLGAAVALLKRYPKLLANVLGAVAAGGDPSKLFLQVEDEYWSRHCTLGGRAQRRPMELIGALRAQQILSNVLLPFAAAMGQIGADRRLVEQANRQYAALPKGESNSLLRLAARQFFTSEAAARRCINTERRQQGAMQILLDFCLNDKSLCRSCRFPRLVELFRDASV